MLGLKTSSRKRAREDAEKPFWISFSDLMTALMVLFLIATAVALRAVAVEETEAMKEQRERLAHNEKINVCLSTVAEMTRREFKDGIQVRGTNISFGTLATFGFGKHQLSDASQQVLRNYVPRVIRLANHPACEDVFKKVVVEGFASRPGTYISNLDLSIKRAERMLCVLLDPRGENSLSEDDRKFVRSKFFVGGASYNDLKDDQDESQRIELQIQFLDYKEAKTGQVRDDALNDQIFTCPLDKDLVGTARERT